MEENAVENNIPVSAHVRSYAYMSFHVNSFVVVGCLIRAVSVWWTCTEPDDFAYIYEGYKLYKDTRQLI